VADDAFDAGPEARAIPERRSRTGLVLIVLVLAAAAAAAFFLLGDDDEDGVATDETTTSTTADSGSTTSTTAAAGSTTVPEGLEQPALWPAADVTFEDPVAAAQDFLDQVLGAGEAGAFREGDARSGEVDALFRGEDGTQEIVRSTLLLRQLGAGGGWFVIAAVNPNATITQPDALAEVLAGPLAVEGIGRGFEATLNVSARIAGAPGTPLDEQVAQGGAEETPLPFSTNLDLSGAAPGDVVTLLVRGGTGLETDPGDFGAIPVVITG
jgi:hypothetical protein